MLKGDRGPKRLNLQLAQTWKSFEKFSIEGEKALSAIKNGANLSKIYLFSSTSSRI